MSRRPPVFVLALTVGDYLLWNWSLNGGHDVLALVAGLSLPPLALVSFWVLAMGAVQLLAATARTLRPGRDPRSAERTAASRAAAHTRAPASGAPRTGAGRTGPVPSGERSRRIAA